MEGAKEHIKQMVDAGVPYEAPEMVQAVAEYTELKTQWDALEQEYLHIRNELTTE